MKHITRQHVGSTVDEPTCALFVAIDRVTCSTPSCGGLRRAGARDCGRCGQASQLGTFSEAGTEEPGAPSAPDL